jgi:SAM-dependent methyltransferase
MEGTAGYVPVIDYLVEAVRDAEFMLVDIGCSGGIDNVWRCFGPTLRALAIDPNIAEIKQLESIETNPGIRYLAAFARLPENHPFALQKAGRSHWGRNPWERLSVVRSLKMMKSEAKLSNDEKLGANLWSEMQLSEEAIVVPECLRDGGIQSVDFLKIDVDGADFEILNSFDLALDKLGILGVGIEVNYFGTTCDTDHTFHNVDRFMKGHGFELFGLTVNRYSIASLPSRYLWHLPARTEFGRPLQGDALYVRDLGSHEYDELTVRLPVTKLLNLICIFAAFNLPDCAAEVALRFGDRLGSFCDVDRILNLLAAQAQKSTKTPLSYREYIQRFETHDPMFFTQSSPAPIEDTTTPNLPLPNRERRYLMLERITRKVAAALRIRQRPDSRVENQMRRDWDDRARKDALYYIVTNAAESEEQFAASGEQSVRDILTDVEHLLPAHATVLEIGCGVGRMLRPLASRFARVYGVDVSSEMVSRAKIRLADLGNVSIWLTEGSTLRPIKADTVDLAISYLVFQHIPEVSIVGANIREAFRVLKPGGLFKFQVAGRPETEEAESAERLRPKDTWTGVSFSESEIRQLVERAGFSVRSAYSYKPPDSCIFLWVIAEKPRRGWAASRWLK